MSSFDIIYFDKYYFHSIMVDMSKKFLSHREMRFRTLLKIIEAILEGALSKRSIQRATGLSWGTVSESMSFLAEKGVVVPVGKNRTGQGAGRKTVTFGFNPEKNLVMGMEVRSDEILYSVADLGKTEIYAGKYTYSGQLAPGNIFKIIKQAFSHVLKKHSLKPEQVPGLVLSLSGALDRQQLVWIQAPRFPRIRNVSFGKLYAILPRVRYIRLEHDINAFALSILKKYRWDENDYLFLQISDGIGMAICERGRFFLGSRGFAGEIGHIPYVSNDRRIKCHCGQYYCLETVLCVKSIFSHVRRKYKTGGHDLVHAAAKLPAHTRMKIFREYINAPLLFLCTVAANVFDPETIIVGGRALEPWFEIMQRSFRKELVSKTWVSSPKHLKFYEESEGNCAYGAILEAGRSILDQFISDLLKEWRKYK